MILKRMISDIKYAIIKGYPFLIFTYIYFVYTMIYIFFYEATDYASIYTSNLFISFALSCIACKDKGLKIIKFDFQFRMTFVYLTLLLISELTIISASIIDNSIIGFKETISNFVLNLFPDMQHELSYEGPLEILIESLFYGLFSPLIYSFACLCFSLKKILSISIVNLLLGTLLFAVNGIVFGVLGLLVQVETDLYFYSPFFAINFLVLIVLSYVVGKNSFAENDS